MRTTLLHFALATLTLLASPSAWSEGEPQIINLPISRPGEPVSLEISIISAYIEVIGEDRQDAEFSVSVENGTRKIITPSGTRPLTGGAYSLQVNEEDNHISVDTDWRANKVSIIARIPKLADLELSTTSTPLSTSSLAAWPIPSTSVASRQTPARLADARTASRRPRTRPAWGLIRKPMELMDAQRSGRAMGPFGSGVV